MKQYTIEATVTYPDDKADTPVSEFMAISTVCEWVGSLLRKETDATEYVIKIKKNS